MKKQAKKQEKEEPSSSYRAHKDDFFDITDKAEMLHK